MEVIYYVYHPENKDANYEYYKHGPLSRAELGDLKVQGLDYAYTIQGWIKGVNSNTMSAVRDPGRDGDLTLGGKYPPEQLHIHFPKFIGSN